jgi:hypothetical protein
MQFAPPSSSRSHRFGYVSDSDDVTSLARSIPNREFEKNAYPPTPCFAMCMQIKGLQRSVVDVCANKGLSGKNRRGPPRTFAAWVGCSSRSLNASLPSFLSALSNPFSAFSAFSVFFRPQNCTIMHFSPKSVLNMHHNALFQMIPTRIPELTTLNSELSTEIIFHAQNQFRVFRGFFTNI